jgi:hypothetical protein
METISAWILMVKCCAPALFVLHCRARPLEAAEERKAIARLTGGLRKQLDTGMIEPVRGWDG